MGNLRGVRTFFSGSPLAGAGLGGSSALCGTNVRGPESHYVGLEICC